MKCAVLSKNKCISVVEMPENDLLADECEVTIRAVGICSSDVNRGYGGGAYFYPLVMGHELSGEITALGKDVGDDFNVGDNVCVFPLLPCFKCASCKQKLYAQCSKYDYYGSRRHGGFAEKLNVCSWNLLKLPHGVSLADGALVEPTAVVVHAIGKASIEPEKHSTLCILGAGFLGLIAVQVVRHLYPNCEVHLVDRNLFKLDVAEIHGASTTLVNNDKSWNNFLRKSESTFDRVIELAGTMATYTAGIMIAKPGARVVWGGNISEDLTISSAQVSSILRKEIEIVGTWNSIYKGIETCDWARALDLIANGLRPSELVSSKINLSEINSTISKLYNHKVRKDKFESIKVLVEPQS